MRFSDDGEPGGTAGRPILEVILKRDLDFLAVAVIRYFGGTRLGAGGLARAYGGSAAKALDSAGEVDVEDRQELRIHVSFALVDPVHRLLAETRDARVGAQEFDALGWRLELELPRLEASAFRQRLADLTRGSATVEEASIEETG
jgi:putative IMPACT (imprinted ancient) family translation regulator